MDKMEETHNHLRDIYVRTVVSSVTVMITEQASSVICTLNRSSCEILNQLVGWRHDVAGMKLRELSGYRQQTTIHYQLSDREEALLDKFEMGCVALLREWLLRIQFVDSGDILVGTNIMKSIEGNSFFKIHIYLCVCYLCVYFSWLGKYRNWSQTSLSDAFSCRHRYNWSPDFILCSYPTSLLIQSY